MKKSLHGWGWGLNLVFAALLFAAGTEVENLFSTPPGPSGKKPVSVIEADYGSFDYGAKSNRHAIFEGNVHVLDPQMEMNCRKMLVFFASEKNEVIRVEAFGSVHIVQQGKEAFSEKAVYTRESGIIVLTEGRPKMKDDKGNWIEGRSIIYDTTNRMMKVEKPTIIFNSSSGGGGGLMSPSAK
ncbi:MAG: LptA/OstA family protein [Verrucomicrobiae bacterium]|nr:LptA/OstA family protein [Verrucomicrobiae bacterium]